MVPFGRAVKTTCGIASASTRSRASLSRSVASVRRASSAALRSVMSALTPSMRSGRPAPSRTTVPLPIIQRTAPSARTVRNSTSYGAA